MSDEVTCIICGKPGVTKWTIHGGGVAVVADLCGDHSRPLNEIVEVAGTTPRRKKVPEWQRATELPRKVTRKPVIEPLDWTPPEER